jgi:aspartyl-tRNA(Asn)/glutamyl-tRNA(Gln) amidotransferase subunit A
MPTIAEVVRQIRARERSAEEVTRDRLERIEALDPSLHAYLCVDAEGALSAARGVDRRLARGEEVGPLSGVPVALKDNLVTRGLETTAGSQILSGWTPPYDATSVARLREAGAVVLGKLNLDEFAMGSSCESSSFGPCKNPWDLARVPGGSSGGAAAAVAAGLCLGALGTDTGGSIRQPAALCGVTGLKPTYGRVSRHGVIAFASSLDQVGPLGRTVLDCAALLEVIAGPDVRDSTCLAQPLTPGSFLAACERDELQGVRVGVPAEDFADEGGQGGLEPDVADAVRGAVARLSELGAEVKEISLPHTCYAVATYYLIATAEASSNLARYDGVRYGRRGPGRAFAAMVTATRQRGFGDEVKRRIMLGTFALSAGYHDAFYGRAQRVRTLIRRDFARAFAECDVIATPTSPFPAFRLGEKVGDPLKMYLADRYTVSCNLAGLPGLSVPCGLCDGLPVGLQLLGPPLGEAAVLEVGAAYQAATGWHSERPPLLGDEVEEV